MKVFRKIALLLALGFCLAGSGCSLLGGTDCKGHVDENSDHVCDECGNTVSNCTDIDRDHLCEVCGIAVSDCLDTNNDHACDVCGGVLTDCKDTNLNHYCDRCNEKISNCADGNSDGACDVCGLSEQETEGTDYAQLTNTITTEYMDGIVSVHASYLADDGYWYGKTSSGVVYDYDEANGAYYLLTNNHGVSLLRTASAAGYETQFTVRDCYETSYDATLVCYDASYDLAVVKIAKNEKHDLTVFSMATANPVAGEEIVCLGSPYGQKNAITYGEVIGYDTCNLHSEDSNITFLCVNHSAWMATGSSGGLLMDLDFNIVGINFAVTNHPTTGEHMSSWAIPVLKVKEFLAANA
ncbi:MAG: trypsin-like peptidase domain-containing protein [Clostridia bacterium]|nr:trypsin-like peptidase domain-containing protein [Clostridia bacterium]